MKRSEIDALIDDAVSLLHAHNIRLPPFAYWTPAEWEHKGPECDEIRRCKLGWDVTDFGSGAFDRVGLVVFTLRNGHHQLPPYTGKPYGEKILIVRENQHTPMHHHRRKTEDIICRSGGTLRCQVYNRAGQGSLADTEVEVSLDGVRHRVEAGHTFGLPPGTSITSIVGEVSSVNDDETDNVFVAKVGRFPSIDEDVPAMHKLCMEY